MKSEVVLGIDVSKKTLDVALIFENRTLCQQFKNTASGFNHLTAWLAGLEIKEAHVCLEATGIYGEAVALFLFNQGHRVSVVNPLRIKGYAAANMQRNKTESARCALDCLVLSDAKASTVATAVSRSSAFAIISAEN